MLGFLRISTTVTLLVSALLFCFPGYSQEISREQIKGLDEQVQEIKSDVLDIAAELSRLEEKLLYPSNTQVAVFVSLARGETMRLDSVEIQLGGRAVTHHLYTFKELEALQKGGVQRIYTGNITAGEHDLQITLLGKATNGSDIRRTENFRVNKDIGPKIVELTLAAQAITFKDR
jgi:hypothetical protein